MGSVLTMYTAEAKSKSKHKIHVTFGDARSYKGKLTLKLKNLDTDKVLLKEAIDFKKLNKRNDCCQVTFSFDPKDSHNGDELRATALEGVQSGGGGWESALRAIQERFRSIFSIDLDEIGCADDSDPTGC